MEPDKAGARTLISMHQHRFKSAEDREHKNAACAYMLSEWFDLKDSAAANSAKD